MKYSDRTQFNYFGEAVYSNHSDGEWKTIIPDTFAENLYYKICNN